ncbi:hypothetical protein BC938DRAFT_473558 [Jimgerdemannia flammicorona]|uniref:Ion transport domain-containing protein n=1 Tax=Jimgerdemannia flammicorona TaxID=994334 RepID=A0A433Q3Z1_9FUNG|nr:hypothetical protein BC938DRAFT_473558 [Jimgerdemannia flammicorona]
MGLLIESIQQILLALLGFWIVLIIVTFAFAHSIWLTVARNSLFTTVIDPTGDASTFATLANAYRSVWFFLTGNYASGLRTDPAEYSALTLLFLISTSIVLMNVLIALMNDVVRSAAISADSVWLRQKVGESFFFCDAVLFLLVFLWVKPIDAFSYPMQAKVIAEIEVYWMFESERRDPTKYVRPPTFPHPPPLSSSPSLPFHHPLLIFSFPHHLDFLIDDQLARTEEETIESDRNTRNVQKTMREENDKIKEMMDDRFKGLRSTVERMEGRGLPGHEVGKWMIEEWKKVEGEEVEGLRGEVEGLKRVVEELVGLVRNGGAQKGGMNGA